MVSWLNEGMMEERYLTIYVAYPFALEHENKDEYEFATVLSVASDEFAISLISLYSSRQMYSGDKQVFVATLPSNMEVPS